MAIVTVTELVLNFAESCRALVPAFDRAEVPWQDESQHDNWDRVAEPLFKSLVTEPCAFQAVGEGGLAKLRLAPYGFAAADNFNAWIAVEGLAQMIALASVAVPFDHVRCGEPNRLVPLNGARFAFVFNANGMLHRLDTVDLAAE